MSELLIPFEYNYMLRAMGISALVGAVAGLLSCYVVLKGWSLMGDALSHAIVPGVVLAWLGGIPFAIGAFTLALCAFISAVYMTVEVDDEALEEDFRRRALWSALAVGICALTSILLAVDDAPLIWNQLIASTLSTPCRPIWTAATLSSAAMSLR